MQVNETPIKTSNSFNINNIIINDIKIPEKKCNFNNIEILADTTFLNTNIKNEKFMYGNGQILEENITNLANHTLSIQENKSKETVQINYVFDDENLQLINNIEIYSKKELNIIIKYSSKTEKQCFHNSKIKVYGDKESKVNITIINLLNIKTNSFQEIENTLENDSNLNCTIIDLGAKSSIINYYSNVIGKEAKNVLKTVYLGIEEQIKDLNYIVHLKGEKSTANIDVQGSLKDEAKKHFKGTIDFKKGCKKAKGNESEYCMLLSNKARSIALPMLLCTEDDVEGNHSAASGKVDEQALFYLMSRGISRSEAIKLLVKANFSKIIDSIKDEKIKEQILMDIDKKLGP